MVSFRDPIHGDLAFDGVIEEIIATEEFQRLAEVKQLGLTDKVYTGASHTRLAHSIGVCYLAGEVCKRLHISPSDALHIQIAALLHDIGHYDFSHALEPLAPHHHEENGRRIIRGEITLPGRVSGRIAQILRAHGIDPMRISALLQKSAYPAHYNGILSNPVLDVDRMDYLKRDTYYTGAVIGEIDVSRLLRVLVIHPQTGELGIHEKGVASMEQFLIARAHMFQQVYLHTDSYAAEAMLRKAVESSIDIARPFLYGDGHLLARLAEQGSDVTRDLVRKLRAGKRSFHKCALIVPADADSDTLIAVERAQRNLFEQQLLTRLNLPQGSIIVTFGHAGKEPTLPTFPVLRDDGTWTDLFLVSSLARAVMQHQTPHPILAIHAASEHCTQVRALAQDLLREALVTGNPSTPF